MRALVTGGAGFLGRHVVWELLARDCKVTVLDPLLTPSSRAGAAELSRSSAEVIIGSTRDPLLVQRLVATADAVFHLASVVGVAATMRDPIATMRNLEGTLNLVELLGSDQVAVFTSSADVYGVHSHYHASPMGETDHEIFEPASVNRWVYGRVKGLEENAICGSRASTVCTRIFNSYGPGMDFPDGRRVIPCLIENVLTGTPMKISGDGSQRRSYCFVEDTVQGLMLALDLAVSAPVHETINIGNDKSFSILETAHMVSALAVELGLCAEPMPIQLQARLFSCPFDDSWSRVPDLTRARALLGYSPCIPLEDGLRRTLRAYRDLATAG